MTRISRRAAAAGLLALARECLADGDTAMLDVGGADLEVSFESGLPEPSRAALMDWVRLAARAVSVYYGRFPVPRARVRIIVRDGQGVSHGTSFGEGGAWCRILVGRNTTASDLDDDWMLTHEMVHFGFPSLSRRHHWMEEGMATYVEPIARVQIGNLTAERVWGDMMRDMPQGLPAAGDRGLDNTHTWGRTYWGGALLCLLADTGIRKHTACAKGFEDALRAINGAGGTITADWPLERALETGDRATGGTVLMDLYERMRAQPVMVDLDGLWKQLGVARRDGRIIFDDRAPLAQVRTSIMRARPTR